MTPDPSDSPGSERPSRRRPRQIAPWAVGLSVSVLAHVAFLFFYGGLSGPPGFSISPGGEGESELVGMEVLNVVAAAEEELERPEEPEEEETERQPVPVAPRGDVSAEEADAPPGARDAPAEATPVGPTAAERLRVPVRGDPRLFAPMASRELGELTMQQFLESDLAWRLGLWADSAAMENARARESLDWTWTDDDGGRWGVSPDGIHLGSVTLPLPTFAPAYGAARERAFINQELARGTAQTIIWESLRERAEAIRRRRDAERDDDRERPTSQLGPRRARPDTTSGGGGG